MDSIDIMAGLRKLGSSQAAVARHLGIRTQSVNDVVRGRYRSRRVERAVARALRKPMATVWPDYYDHAGIPRDAA